MPPLIEGSPRELIGRDKLVGELTCAPSGVWLITGDSGIGKSAVLEAACRQSTSSINPEPYAVGFSESLETALFGVLGQVASLIAEDADDIRGLMRRMATATSTVAALYFNQLPFILFGRLLGVVGDHTGLPVDDFIDDIQTQMQDESAAGVGKRATEARGEIAAETFQALAEALTEAAKDRDTVLALDTRTDIRKVDRRLLADVAERLPETFSIWLTLSTGNQAGNTASNWLQENSDGIAEFEVSPLSIQDVRGWLASLGIEERFAQALHRASNGYPLVIEQLTVNSDIRLGGFPALEITKGFSSLVRDTLAQLDPQSREIAKRLALLRDPPPSDETASVLGVTQQELADARFQLQQSRLLTVKVAGQPWFHERRRQAIVESSMEPTERGAFSDSLAESIWALAKADPAQARRLLPLATSVELTKRIHAEAAQLFPADGKLWHVLAELLSSSRISRDQGDRLMSDAIAAGAMNDSLFGAVLGRGNRQLKFETFRAALAQRAELSALHTRTIFLALRDEIEPVALKALEAPDTPPAVLAAALEAVPRRTARPHAKRLIGSTGHVTLLISCLKILGRSASPRAREILKDPETNAGLRVAAIGVLPRGEAQRAAVELLDEVTDVGLAARCLQILGMQASARAGELIAEPKTPSSLVCVALNCLPAGEQQQAASALLARRSEPDLLCTCLELAGPDGARRGIKILERPGDHPPAVLAKSLALFGSLVPEAARELLREDSAPEVQARAIDVLGEDAAPFARRQLLKWRAVNPTMLSRCFQVAKESRESTQAAQEILEDFDRSIPATTRVSALRNAPDTPLRTKRAMEVLEDWRKTYRPLVTAAMMAFWAQPALVATPCQAILRSWRNEVVFQQRRPPHKRYQGHILKAMSNPSCNAVSVHAAKEILAADEEDSDLVPDLLRKGAEDTINGTHLPWSNVFAGTNDDGSPAT